jgi:hypothetical protein
MLVRNDKRKAFLVQFPVLPAIWSNRILPLCRNAALDTFALGKRQRNPIALPFAR